MSFDPDQHRFNNLDQHDELDPTSNPFNLDWVNEVLVLVNVRLGVHQIEENYQPKIGKFLKLSQSVGMIGGKPDKAFYFFGMKNEQ